MKKLQVYLWDATTAARDVVLDGMQAHVTDIARNEWAPTRGSLLIGMAHVDRGDEEFSVILLGQVSTKSEVSTGRNRFRVEPLLVPDPIPFADLVAELSSDVRSRIESAGLPVDARPVPLSATAGSAVVEALKRRPGVSEWLDGLEEVPWHRVSSNTRAVLEEGSDALRTALEASGFRVPLSEVQKPRPDIFEDDVLSALVQDAHLRDNEDALINADLRRFAEDTEVIDDFAAHAVLLQGHNHTLAVLNVNRMELEHALGVDLIYWDLEHKTATMLQYKRLDKEPPSNEWRFSYAQELKNQLELMQTRPLTEAELEMSWNWRMTSPYWFKFVRRDAAKDSSKLLLKGMYVPADYLRVAIADDSLRQGPRGGFHVTYASTFYITRDTFTELLRKGVIGTAGAQSTDVAELIKLHASADRTLLLAIKDKKEKWGVATAPAVGGILAPVFHSGQEGGDGDYDDDDDDYHDYYDEGDDYDDEDDDGDLASTLDDLIARTRPPETD